jgi:hypothetical protein
MFYAPDEVGRPYEVIATHYRRTDDSRIVWTFAEGCATPLRRDSAGI